MQMEPRVHHMNVKYQLVRMALEDPFRFFETFGDSGDRQYLWKLWEAIGHKYPIEARVSADGLTATQIADHPGYDILMITFPSVTSVNEAYFFALMRCGGVYRVFCLEAAINSISQDVDSFVAEFMANGRANWGKGCMPTATAFSEMIVNLHENINASPLSFFPVALI